MYYCRSGYFQTRRRPKHGRAWLRTEKAGAFPGCLLPDPRFSSSSGALHAAVPGIVVSSRPGCSLHWPRWLLHVVGDHVHQREAVGGRHVVDHRRPRGSLRLLKNQIVELILIALQKKPAHVHRRPVVVLAQMPAGAACRLLVAQETWKSSVRQMSGRAGSPLQDSPPDVRRPWYSCTQKRTTARTASGLSFPVK